jgi:hypothetical protein
MCPANGTSLVEHIFTSWCDARPDILTNSGPGQVHQHRASQPPSTNHQYLAALERELSCVRRPVLVSEAVSDSIRTYPDARAKMSVPLSPTAGKIICLPYRMYCCLVNGYRAGPVREARAAAFMAFSRRSSSASSSTTFSRAKLSSSPSWSIDKSTADMPSLRAFRTGPSAARCGIRPELPKPRPGSAARARFSQGPARFRGRG